MNNPQPHPQILIVDDKKNMLRLLSKVLRNDAKVITSETGEKAIEWLKKESFQVVLSDLRMSGINGIEVYKHCKIYQPQAQFILMTAYASEVRGIEGLELSNMNFIPKPFDPEYARSVVLLAIGRASKPS